MGIDVYEVVARADTRIGDDVEAIADLVRES